MNHKAVVAALCFAAVPISVFAQTDGGSQAAPASATADSPPEVPVVAPAAEAAEDKIEIADGTLVKIAIGQEMGSENSQIDQMFPISLAAPLSVNGADILPLGLTGEGQVVHAAKAKGGGRGGELILAARYIQCGDTKIALRGFRLNSAGDDKSDGIVAGQAVVGLVALPLSFLKGGKLTLPKGMIGTAKISGPLTLSKSTLAACMPQMAVVPPLASTENIVSDNKKEGE